MGTCGMNDSNADSLFPIMTRVIFYIQLADVTPHPGQESRQACYLGVKKCSTLSWSWSAIPNFSFPSLLPWTRSSFKMSCLVSFRVVQNAWYHLTASTLPAIDIATCSRKVKKRHANTTAVLLTVMFSLFTLVCTAVAGCSLEVLGIDYASNRHFGTVQMWFVLYGLIVILSTADRGEEPAVLSLSTLLGS